MTDKELTDIIKETFAANKNNFEDKNGNGIPDDLENALLNFNKNNPHFFDELRKSTKKSKSKKSSSGQICK
jgi:uncharacterized protein YdeI (YjbR/CyaY-like superfamily)